MLKKLLFSITIIAFLGLNNVSANTFIERTLNGYSANVIEYSTDSKFYDIHIGVHPSDGGTLRSIMSEVNGITGVNGVFECPKDYTACGGKNYTINERYVEGEKLATYKSTGDRVVFGWNEDIEPLLFQTDTINKDREDEIYEGFANHPLILMNGENQLPIYHEKGLIDSKMKSYSTKNFICGSKSGEKIYFGLVYGAPIDAMPDALLELGCWNAINLDAGYSTSFIYNNKYITGPQREILDGVFVSPKNVDIAAVNIQAKTFLSALLDGSKNKTTSQKIVELNKYSTIFDTYVIKTYQKNTSDITDEKIIYSETLILEKISENEKALEFIKTSDFDTSNGYFIRDDNIYKKEISEIQQVKVGTKIEFTSDKTIKNIALINIIREYIKAIIPVYQEIEKLESLDRLDDSLDINVSL